jgi:hypothetical protein
MPRYRVISDVGTPLRERPNLNAALDPRGWLCTGNEIEGTPLKSGWVKVRFRRAVRYIADEKLEMIQESDVSHRP